MRAALISIFAFAAGPALADPGLDAFNNSCANCHTISDASDDAPTLKGVFGRKIASLSDFQYSDALKAKTGVWDEANLDAFLASPKTFAPGTVMYGAASDPAARKAIIDYLKTVK